MKKPPKKPIESPFSVYLSQRSPVEQESVQSLLADVRARCQLARAETKRLVEDFEQAILYYDRTGLPLKEALERLSPKKLGGFYARTPTLWFALDDAAKIYPLSMQHGQMAVFRLSFYLDHEVVPELLQMALNFTIKRFPSFSTTLKKGVFWHYLDTAKRRFHIEPENDIPCQPLPISRSGSQSFRVVYYRNRISVEFFHVLTDGSGGMAFLKVLTAEYLRLWGAEMELDDTLWDINTPPSAAEFENAFASVPRRQEASGFVDKPAVQMNGRLAKVKPCRVLHLNMPEIQLKAAANRHQATVTAYLLALMFLAGKASTDEQKGEQNIQVPVNMRKFYPSKTIRNFAMYCGIRLSLEDITSVDAILPEIALQLRQKASQEAMGQMVTSAERMVGALRFVPLVVKQPVARVIYGFLGDKIFTNTLSNLGVVRLPPSMAAHVRSCDFLLGTAITNRASCSVVTCGDVTTFSIAKMTADPTFEETLCDLLQADGIEVCVEGSGLYEG